MTEPVPPATASVAPAGPGGEVPMRALSEQVAQEQLRLVLSHTRLGTVLATVFALGMAGLLSPAVPPMALKLWLTAKLGIALLRIVLAQQALRGAQELSPASRRLTYSLLAVDAAVWGIAGAWLMSRPEPVASLVAASLACITCLATFGLQVRTLATAAYAAPILAPTAAGLMLRGDEFGLVGGVGLLLVLGAQLFTAHGAQQRLAAMVRLRLQALALAGEKAAALQLAQEQSEAKSQFMGKLSHELRTPLHGILGLAQLLQLELTDPRHLRRMALIESSGMHLLTLINDLLDVSRIQAGRFELRPQNFELVAEFEQVAELFALRAQAQGLRFEREARLAAPYWVEGDALRWRQVLNNLLGNALKFTSEGAVTMRLSLGAEPGIVMVEVIDTGVGIAADELPQIFQAFAQSAHGSASPTEGAGLGLTIAREIAQSMGGDITAASQLGHGSTFSFFARLPPAGVAGAAAPRPPSSPASPAAPRRVLVAEDDEVNAMIVGAFLESAGISFERVGDGVQAVAAALRETDRPDLLLMDCRMPELDGLAATREIRRREAALGLPRLPIVALTATSSESDRDQCLAAGMDGFVGKPFTREELMRAIGPPSGQAASA